MGQAQIINGNEIAKQMQEEMRLEVEKLKAESGSVPGLAVILVGEDPASKVYVKNKGKACDKIGFYSEQHNLPEDVSETKLLELVEELNKKDNINGILVQLPLPKHIDSKKVIQTINPIKDVDGFHPINVGDLMIDEAKLAPCTPSGVMELLKRTGINLVGKNAVVVGRSNIVGKPVSLMLLKEHCTVTICHSRTRDLEEVCKKADILVAAVGKPEMITGDMIKEGAVVIDVGVNRLDNGKLVGDVHFESASQKASYITPVPGGVGPMTITMLMHNTLKAFKMHTGRL